MEPRPIVFKEWRDTFKEWRVMNNVDRVRVIVLFVL
jgi:hypothetical protein